MPLLGGILLGRCCRILRRYGVVALWELPSDERPNGAANYRTQAHTSQTRPDAVVLALVQAFAEGIQKGTESKASNPGTDQQTMLPVRRAHHAGCRIGIACRGIRQGGGREKKGGSWSLNPGWLLGT